MHSAYYSIKPCGNRYLQMKWDDNYYNEHLKRVAEAKSIIDTRAPRTYLHMHLKLKKLKLEDERIHIIERDNRILLEKMARIMRTGGRIDNINHYIPKSLNLRKRQLELLQICRQNQGIVERMLEQKKNCRKNTAGDFGMRSWRKSWKETMTYMDNISKFPKNWWTLKDDDFKPIFCELELNEAIKDQKEVDKSGENDKKLKIKKNKSSDQISLKLQKQNIKDTNAEQKKLKNDGDRDLEHDVLDEIENQIENENILGETNKRISDAKVEVKQIEKRSNSTSSSSSSSASKSSSKNDE